MAQGVPGFSRISEEDLGEKGGLSRSGSFDDRSAGTWLGLCPSHSKLLERHCVKLYFLLEGENESLDSDVIVERFKHKERLIWMI